MSTNKLTNSKFFMIQDAIRSKHDDYNKYIKTIKNDKQEKENLSFINRVKKMLGLNYE